MEKFSICEWKGKSSLKPSSHKCNSSRLTRAERIYVRKKKSMSSADASRKYLISSIKCSNIQMADLVVEVVVLVHCVATLTSKTVKRKKMHHAARMIAFINGRVGQTICAISVVHQTPMLRPNQIEIQIP